VTALVCTAADSVAYDESDAKLYVEYARAAFCDQSSLENWNCGDICDNVPIEAGSVYFLGPGSKYEVQGYVAALPSAVDNSSATVSRRCVAAFRGSVRMKNWVADAKAQPIAWPLDGSESWCPGCMVHRGFAFAYEELRLSLFAALDELSCERLVVTGHSLGAAVATLTAIELRAAANLAVEPVWLYGAPRVGNLEFVDAFIAAGEAQRISPPVWRVVHYHDPVPRLAPTFYPFGYRHLPGEVLYSEAEDSFRRCSMVVGEDLECDSVPLRQCITLDHLTYMNHSFRSKMFQPECISRNRSLLFSIAGPSRFFTMLMV